MRVLFLRIIFGTATLAASVAFPQMHKVAKPQQVVRAVGVYEWTGDFAKPTASRLIPVSLFIENKFEDAGIYIARPIPFALLPGNLYILQSAGIDKGTLDLAYAKHLQAVEPTGDLAFDDGWFGYGSVKPLSAPRKTATALKPSKTVPVITASADPNRPHFGSKPADPASSGGSDQSKPDTTTTSSTTSPSTSSDPDRPTMKRRTSDTSGSGTSDSGTSPTASSTPTTTSPTPADDPDRPTMKRRTPDSTTSGSDTTTASTPSTTSTGSSTTADTTSTTSNTPSAADDPDRPTLKRHTPEDANKAKSGSSDIATASGSASLNDDPNRPNLHHGKPTSAMNETDLPKLTGLPVNLHQMVAVSDAANRDPHPFTLDWDDEAQHKAILEKMQTMARAQLAAYGSTPATPAPPPTPAAKKTTPPTARTHRPAAVPAPQTPLLDEDLKAYTLSYGGAATYIYSANTGGTGAALRYVTIVAQADGLGDIKPAIQSVTDAAHFNRTPKMQFVDAVDADATNRASLLFELRSQNARQFALYRVIASHPEQIFLTGTTQ
ncbi:MAG: hypothetical protein JWQ49_511 [Edaphobacter sp.]|nr:hypothetical protein [Edaphobacter sp.]